MMTIVKSEGCMAWGLEADGKPVREMDEAQKLEVFSKLVKQYDVPTEDLIDFIAEKYGEYDCSDTPCECCGDYITTYTLNIP